MTPTNAGGNHRRLVSGSRRGRPVRLVDLPALVLIQLLEYLLFVDGRRLIYLIDRAAGLDILRLTEVAEAAQSR